MGRSRSRFRRMFGLKLITLKDDQCRLTADKGITLIEIVVVVALIAIMATIAVPSMRALLPQYQLRGAAREIASAMQLGRVRALSTGNTFYIDFDYNNEGVEDGFFVCYLDTDGDGSADADDLSASKVTPNDVLSGVPIVRLPRSVSYGVAAAVKAAAAYSDAIGDGVAVDVNGAKRIEFHPDGRAAINSSGTLPTIYLHNNRGGSCAIQVNMLGRIEVLKWGGSGWG